MTNILIISGIVTILLAIYLTYKYQTLWKMRWLVIKAIHSLHPDSIVEDFNTIEQGVITEINGTGVFPNKGRLEIFEFKITIANGKVTDIIEKIEIPYNKRSFKHELTSPEKINHWRKDQLDNLEKKDA